MKIIFFGNWNIGYITLKRLLEQLTVIAVVTNYDQNDDDRYRNRVYDLACLHGVPVYKGYRDILDLAEEDTVGFSVAYGNEIFREDILSKIKIYNFHPSYLPRYKGPSPIQWQIRDRREEWGMSCHEVNSGIDTGQIVGRSHYAVNMELVYEKVLDDYNKCFSDFIYEHILEIIGKLDSQEAIETISNDNRKEYYYPRLLIPECMRNCTLYEIADYLNWKRVVFFAGNRAELGILLPLILEMSRFYYIDMMVADSYDINGAEDLQKKENYIKANHYAVNKIRLSVVDSHDPYFNALPNIYRKVFDYLKKQTAYPYKYAVVLGDRIESLGFALAAFYGKVPLVHVAGGDVSNIPYFDTSVRHCISKLAGFHLAFSDTSAETLEQLGEEEEKICNIGNPTFDYDRMHLLADREEIEREFHIGEKICVIFTYHSGPLKSEYENLKEYKECLKGILDSKAGKIIITYPNHDPGSTEVIRYLDQMVQSDRVVIVKSLGTAKLHAIMSGFKTIIAGNSSSGLLETSYYMCPALNIGDRQDDRARGGNVTDVKVDSRVIMNILNQEIEQYDIKKDQYLKYKNLYGDGRATEKAVRFLKKFEEIPNEKLIIKKFVKRVQEMEHEDNGGISSP